MTAIASAMEEIRERVDAIARDIVTLSERTQQIGEITATVNGLADSSKLLALNASIEAARAGEHGQGLRRRRRGGHQARRAVQGRHGAGRGDPERRSGGDERAVLASQEGTKVVEHGLELTERAGEGIRSLSGTIQARPATPPSRSRHPLMSRASGSSRSRRP